MNLTEGEKELLYALLSDWERRMRLSDVEFEEAVQRWPRHLRKKRERVRAMKTLAKSIKAELYAEWNTEV